MKQKLLIIGIAIVVIVALVSGSKAAIFYYGSGLNVNVASTTSQFILANGVATTTFSTDGYESTSLLIALASSSTAPTLCWVNQFSDNQVDWYSEDSLYASSTLHVGTQRSDCFTYSSSTANSIFSSGSDGVTRFIGKKIEVSNHNTIFGRTIFTVTGANARLDVRLNKKNQIVILK